MCSYPAGNSAGVIIPNTSVNSFLEMISTRKKDVYIFTYRSHTGVVSGAECSALATDADEVRLYVCDNELAQKQKRLGRRLSEWLTYHPFLSQ